MLNRLLPVITREDAETGLLKALAEKGEDYIYPKSRPNRSKDGAVCKYFDKEQQPSCLVGHVMVFAGYEPFGYYDNDNGSSIITLVNRGSVRVEGISSNDVCLETPTFSPALNILYIAQGYQDRGCPWGQAVKWALAGEEDHHATAYNPETEEWDWV